MAKYSRNVIVNELVGCLWTRSLADYCINLNGWRQSFIYIRINIISSKCTVNLSPMKLQYLWHSRSLFGQHNPVHNWWFSLNYLEGNLLWEVGMWIKCVGIKCIRALLQRDIRDSQPFRTKMSNWYQFCSLWQGSDGSHQTWWFSGWETQV